MLRRLISDPGHLRVAADQIAIVRASAGFFDKEQEPAIVAHEPIALLLLFSSRCGFRVRSDIRFQVPVRSRIHFWDYYFRFCCLGFCCLGFLFFRHFSLSILFEVPMIDIKFNTAAYAALYPTHLSIRICSRLHFLDMGPIQTAGSYIPAH
jgi:hypothetical protein